MVRETCLPPGLIETKKVLALGGSWGFLMFQNILLWNGLLTASVIVTL